jgi:hypothetical protein
MRIHRWRIGATVLAAAILVVATPASAQERYTVGVEAIAYFPQYGVDDTGAYGGFGRAILDAFATDAGIELVYKPLPVKRLFFTFVDGEVDFKYPDSAEWGRDLKAGVEVTYSDPVVTYYDATMVRPQDKGRTRDDIDTLGTVSGFTPWAWDAAVQAGAVKVHGNPTFKGLVGQAMLGRVDAAYANRSVIQSTLEDMGEPGALVFDAGLPYVKGSYKLSTVKHPTVIARFNAWMTGNAAKVERLKQTFGVGEVNLAERQ